MRPVRTLVLLALFLALASGAAAGAQDRPKPVGMNVQVLRTAVRESPSVAGAVIGFLEYGTRVSVVGNESGWSRISLAHAPWYGWIRDSALTSRRIDPGPEVRAEPGVHPVEYALAGRGFDRQIEETYRASTRLDYSWVDIMESYRLDERETASFVEVVDRPDVLR